MHHIIPVGIMMDIITGVAIGIIPIFQAVITGAPATLGIIDKIRTGIPMIPMEEDLNPLCSKNGGLEKGEIR